MDKWKLEDRIFKTAFLMSYKFIDKVEDRLALRLELQLVDAGRLRLEPTQ